MINTFCGARISALLIAVAVLGALFPVGSLATAPAEPWDGPAFSAPPAALLRAASAVPAPGDARVLILMEERQFQFDTGGRMTFRYRLVYRILNDAAGEGWSAIGTLWEPWHQQRPSLRARVITAAGTVHELDPATIAEEPAARYANNVFSDRRVLRAPLPAIAAGAIVEGEIITRDTAPLFDAGVVWNVWLGQRQPTRRARVTIEAPASLPLQYVTRLLPGVEPRREERAGRIHVIFDIPAMEPLQDGVPFVPGDVPNRPSIAFSTARSWAQVAARYGEIVEGQLAGASLPAVAGVLESKPKSREVAAAALLAWLQREIRYTGVEFGEASYVPRTPAETLKRKYGDCKDKATLLVAALRAAGFPAYLALLSTGPGHDVEPSLPGFGAFNHVIVYVPGRPDLWIDPTDEFARAGELPAGDQGRLALIVRPETIDLARIPEAPSTANRVVETREVFLAELGGGRIVETTEAWGGSERALRQLYATANAKDLQEHLDEYAENTFLTDKAVKYQHSDPRDLTTPFRLTIEMQESKRAPATTTEAVVGIPLGGLISRLPFFLRIEEEVSEGSEGAAGRKPDSASSKRRAVDLELPEPFVTEWRYRVVPAPGFQAKPLPQGSQERMGPALLTREFVLTAERTVSATFRFDTVKRRYSPQEVEELRAGLRRLLKEEGTAIQFEQVGETHLAAGRIREALAEFRSLAADHPAEALHRLQIARALLAAGAGEAARKLAREAVQIEPKSASAYQTLSSILQHDLIGRPLKKGFDRAGAEAALRKAVELDPSDIDFKAQLAILLEHDDQAVRYSPKANLNEAIALYQSILEKIENPSLANNLPLAMMKAGRFAEAYKLAQSKRDLPHRLGWLVASRTVLDGTAAGMAEVKNVMESEENRRAAFREAADLLQDLRCYPQAAELLAASAHGTPDAAAQLARAEFMRKLRKREDLGPRDDDPRTVVKKFMTLFLTEGLSAEKLRPFFSRHVHKQLENPEELQNLQETALIARSALQRAGVASAVIADIMMSAIDATAEGDDAGGYRVRVQGMHGDEEIYFVVREGHQYRLLNSDRGFGGVGKEVLSRLEKGDLAAARRWLDWVREEVKLPGGDDPFAGPPFPRFWTRGHEGARETMRYAAAALILRSDPEMAIPILRQGLALANTDVDRLRFELALVHVLGELEKLEEVLPLARHFLQASPDSASAYAFTQGTLAMLGQWQEVERLAEERLKRRPNDPETLAILIKAAIEQGKYKQADELARRLATGGRARPGDFNNIAWQSLFRGAVTEEMAGYAQRAVHLTKGFQPAYLHTLAAVYAELGKPSDARELALTAMDLLGLEEPDGDYDYVFGRIAEQYGIHDAAAAFYRKVEKPKHAREVPDSSYRLAQMRLTALEKHGGTR